MSTEDELQAMTITTAPNEKQVTWFDLRFLGLPYANHHLRATFTVNRLPPAEKCVLRMTCCA